MSRALLLALVLASSIQAGGAQAAETRSFTVETGTNFAAAMSPDGKRIAIDLQGELRLMPAAGGEARAVPGLDGEVRLPAWSPDGSRLAFQYYVGGQWRIAVLDADGARLRQLTFGTSDDREPVWTPDGASLVFASDRAGNFDIWKVAADGSGLAQLTSAPEDEYTPAVAPDGAQVAFVSAGRDRQLRIRAADGTVRTVVSAAEELAFPDWSADGGAISYLSYRVARLPAAAGGSAVKSVDLAGGAVTTLTAPGEDVFVGRPQRLSGGRLLYTADGRIKLKTGPAAPAVVPFRAPFTVARAWDFTPRARDFTSDAPHPVQGILHPVVSPDGRQVAFTALGDLWLLTVGDPKPARLTDDAFMEIEPAWSPDGRTLAYVSDRRGVGTLDLYLRDMATGQERRLTETVESLSMPVFSPDGSKIALTMLVSDDWHANTPHVLDLKTGELRKIHDWLFKPSVASWLPDGRTVAYVSLAPRSQRFRHGLNEILLVPADGGPSRFVTPTPGRTLGIRARSGAMWSPDGRTVAFVQEGVLWTVPVGPGGAFTAAPRRMTSEIADEPSWTADSKSIVFLSVDRLKRLYLDDAHVEDIPLTLEWRNAVPQGRTVVQVGRLFDGRTLAYRRDVDVVVDGATITEIVPRRAAWPGAKVIDARTKAVVPGLFENHIHNFSINGEQTGRIALSYGITSVREPGAEPGEALEQREAWASGRRAGPRLFTTGLLEGSRIFYPMSLPVASPAGLELELERADRLGYDFIKSYERLDNSYQKRIVEAAHRMGVPITSHDAYPSATFGADAVEHMATGDRLIASDRLSLNGRAYDDIVQIYAQSGMAVVPTLAGANPNTAAQFLKDSGRAFKDLRQLKLLAPRVLASRYIKGAIDEAYTPFSSSLLAASGQAFTALRRAGVPIPPGTDTSFFNLGLGIVGELQYYVTMGMTPAEALQMGSLGSARLGAVDDKLGSLEPGKLADLVVVDGDPLKNLLDVLNVELVMKGGQAFTFEQLAAGAELGGR
jgi:Tol biopolymer transport system component/imidazolonepropionase-like amidohydrolase